ncbi:MAG: HNH endonuclease, partial [bacterium]
MKDVDFYVNKFARLHTDASPKRWSELTCHRAPHKPLLLLSVLDLFAQKALNTNLIEITNDLAEIFLLYWSKIMNQGQRGNLALPFFHLRSEKFWHLIAKSEKEDILANLRQMRSIHQLGDIILGARLDEELFF